MYYYYRILFSSNYDTFNHTYLLLICLLFSCPECTSIEKTSCLGRIVSFLGPRWKGKGGNMAGLHRIYRYYLSWCIFGHTNNFTWVAETKQQWLFWRQHHSRHCWAHWWNLCHLHLWHWDRGFLSPDETLNYPSFLIVCQNNRFTCRLNRII